MIAVSKKILVVALEKDSVPFVSALEKADFDVFKAVTKADALDILSREKPAIFVIDLSLEDSFQILEAKHKDRVLQGIPVIVLSEKGDTNEINKALSLGANDYFIKSQFDKEEFVVKIREQSSDVVDTDMDSGSSKVSGQNFDLSSKKIMWVEDDKFLSDILAKKLSTQSSELVNVADGSEAIDTINRVKPDIILLDILLPGKNGFEILEEVKKNPDTKNIPIILLSNLGQKEDIEKGKRLGAEKFLVKATVSLDEIVDEIKNVLKNRETSSA